MAFTEVIFICTAVFITCLSTHVPSNKESKFLQGVVLFAISIPQLGIASTGMSEIRLSIWKINLFNRFYHFFKRHSCHQTKKVFFLTQVFKITLFSPTKLEPLLSHQSLSFERDRFVQQF